MVDHRADREPDGSLAPQGRVPPARLGEAGSRSYAGWRRPILYPPHEILTDRR
jgi:hypothetical protein